MVGGEEESTVVVKHSRLSNDSYFVTEIKKVTDLIKSLTDVFL